MVQVGMQAALTCPIVGISRIHLVYGDPVQQAHDETTGATEYLIYLGFGFLSRER